MPLDGITASSVVMELNSKLEGGRIDKIHQPEPDEIAIMIRAKGENHRLLLSADASRPRIHLTALSKENPQQAPMFCMVLRKHLSGGKILGFDQPSFERVISMRVESMSEMGDLSTKRLITEIMGKHSNIILLDEAGTVLDAVKRIPFDKSTVRQMLPGMLYQVPPGGKKDPLEETKQGFLESLGASGIAQDRIFRAYNGISPAMAAEICLRAGVDASDGELSDNAKNALTNSFFALIEDLKTGRYKRLIYFDAQGKPKDFSAVELSVFEGLKRKEFEHSSKMLEEFYSERDKAARLSQRTQDLRKITQNSLDRCRKKADIHMRTLKAVEDRELDRIRGDILMASLYDAKKGMTTYETQNFYSETGEMIAIPLDPQKTPSENAQAYYKKYAKAKRAEQAVTEQQRQNLEDIAYLEGVAASILQAADESDMADIRDELTETGFLKKKTVTKGMKRRASKPLHFISSDGLDIYVGKNNKQNDELTLRTADPTDIWLHAKDMPGSHVIVKTNGSSPPVKSIEEAALLAAFYSKGKASSNVPIDYCPRRNVKKPSGAKPGFVIYEKYNTAYVTPSEEFAKGMAKGK
ncbi:MAG: NFACT family protein [Clostridiales bacterium]|nr:NFACT family protein [Clostridiales bacterium]